MVQKELEILQQSLISLLWILPLMFLANTDTVKNCSILYAVPINVDPPNVLISDLTQFVFNDLKLNLSLTT